MESLSPKVIRSGFWSLGGNWLSKGLGMVKIIILARLLSPIDFGILGLAIVSMNVLNVFSETGIESALIQRDTIDRAELDTAWTISITRGLVLSLLLFVSARWFAYYFENPDLIPVLKVMAIGFIIGGFNNIGIVFFQKELEFNKKIILDLISDFAGAIAAVLLAFWLRNVWALVMGSIVWGIAKCFGSYSMHPYRPKIYWDREAAKGLLNFGKHIFWITLVTFIVTSGDDAIVGKVLGLTMLGFYTMAYNIANIPVSGLAGIIGRISFPAYSKLQNEPERLSEAFKKIFESLLLILFPMTALLIMLARDFTLIFLGDKWLPMVPVLQVLCLLGLFRGLANMFSPIQLAVNRPEIQSKNKTIELLLFLLLVYPFTMKWGVVGAGWSVTIVYLGSALVNVTRSASLVPRFYRIIGKASLVPILATFGLVCSTWGVHFWVRDSIQLIQFLLPGVAGVIVCGTVVITLNKEMLQDIVSSLLKREENRQQGKNA
jgi:O-antigen/teichoic acid export membrane protein